MYKRGVAATVLFKAIDSTDGVSGKAGLTFTTKNIIKDGAAPTPLTSAPTECGGGWYLASLTATEFTAESVGLDFQVSGAVIAPIVIHTEADYTVARAAAIDSIGTATNAGDMATKQADSAALTTGTNTSGSYSNTATDDDVYWITAPVSPAVGGFGLRQQLTFNLPLGRTPVGIQVRGYFNGSSSSVDVYALNSRTATYDKLTNTKTDLASRSNETLYSIPLPRDYADNSGGSYNVVTLEFRTASTNTAHRLRLDQVLIAHVAEAVAITLTAPSAEQIWSYAVRELTTPGAEPVTVPTAAEVRAEIDANSTQLAAIKAKTDSLTFTVAGQVDANTLKVGGTTQTARDIGASVLLSSGTGTGQLKLASGYVAMTLADVAAPTSTLNLSGTTVAAVSGAVGSVTGAVGSVTGLTASNLDATISSRLASASYTAPPTAATNATAVRTELGTELGRIDAAISSRSTYAGADTAGTTTLLSRVTAAPLLASSYTAPDNASIAAIGGIVTGIAGDVTDVLADTNELQAEWADGGRLDLILDSAASGGSAPTASEIADEVETRTLNANIQKVNGIAINGTGAPGDTWGP